MKFTSICIVVALFALTTAGQALAVNIEGLPIKIGDSVETVQKALGTDLEPEKEENIATSAIRPNTKTKLRLKTKGIWVFFNKGKVYTIRLEKPFSGNIGGVKPGDPSSKIEKTFGPPVKRGTSFGKFPTYTYYFDDITTTRFDVNQDDEIETIFLIK
jgi:hypothetical protein